VLLDLALQKTKNSRRKNLHLELYFIATDQKMMAVGVTASGEKFEHEMPAALFPTHMVSGVAASLKPQYDVWSDGRFLINQPAEESVTTPITLILNWKPPAK